MDPTVLEGPKNPKGLERTLINKELLLMVPDDWGLVWKTQNFLELEKIRGEMN